VQRATIIALAAFVPSMVLAFYSDTILVAAGQPPDVAVMAREYVMLVQPALLGIALMTILQRVLQAEGHILANFYISFIVFLLAPQIQYWLIIHWGYGLRGAGMAFSIYNCIYLLLMVPYMFWSGLGHVFVLQRSTLSGVGMYEHLRLAVPGLFCQLLEWASMELVTIIAGTYIWRHSAQALLSHALLVSLRCQHSCTTLSL
jgi:MATE family multidrug resistance protein